MEAKRNETTYFNRIDQATVIFGIIAAFVLAIIVVTVATSAFALSRADVHGGDTSLVHACVNTTNGDVRITAALGAGDPSAVCSDIFGAT